jgi:II/X family phage/plasmid replication protein
MIDMLVLRCNFSKQANPHKLGELEYPMFRLETLGIPLEKFIDKDGEEMAVRHPWERIPSHFEGMAFKVFDHRFDALDCFYIEIKASPAKIMQGHNVYGSSDFYDCSMSMLNLLSDTYPELFALLDHASWSLVQIDITFASRAKDNNEARAFINALQNVSYGHTKSRTGYDGTAYFGKKNSRLKKIKVYHKAAEVIETVKKNAKKSNAEELAGVYTNELLKFSDGMIRWEVSLYHRYFERLGITTNLKDIFKTNAFSITYLQNYWRLATSDLFKALKGQSMKTINDDEIQKALRAKFTKFSLKTGKSSTSAADSAFRTYRDIRRDGWEITKDSMTRMTFSRHLKMITECGVSRAALQNMNGLDNGAKIIPFVRFIEVDFGAQFPDWYVPPPSKYVYEENKKAVNF